MPGLSGFGMRLTLRSFKRDNRIFSIARALHTTSRYTTVQVLTIKVLPSSLTLDSINILSYCAVVPQVELYYLKSASAIQYVICTAEGNSAFTESINLVGQV